MADGIDIRRHPYVRNTPQYWIRLECVVDHPARALVAVAAMVIHPRLPQHLLAEAAGPIFAVPVVLCIRAGKVVIVLERVGASAQGNDRLARVEVIYEVF